jgi:DNA polymerase III subunit delta
MITVLTGENGFEIMRATAQIVTSFDGTAEKIDGSELELKQLPDLLMGATLFADKRLVIIKNLSENKTLWSALTDWLPRVSGDVQLVLVDEKLDKRTKTYKDLQKIADVKEFKLWGERDSNQAEKWAVEEAQRLGFALDKKSAQLLVARVGVDQWLLAQALQKLAVTGKVTPAVIEELIDANPTENVFNLFEAALNGDGQRVAQMISTLQQSEDAYRLLGLMSTQAFQLLALALSDKSSSEVAKDLGAHPFAVSKLSRHAKRLGKPGAKKVFTTFVEADTAMKTSAADPWLLIERALIKVVNI